MRAEYGFAVAPDGARQWRRFSTSAPSCLENLEERIAVSISRRSMGCIGVFARKDVVFSLVQRGRLLLLITASS